jgi:hypothetical protein
MTDYTSPWTEGFDAFRKGEPLENCPYSQEVFPVRREAWIKAWEDAENKQAEVVAEINGPVYGETRG